jgi:hypothetical protein
MKQCPFYKKICVGLFLKADQFIGDKYLIICHYEGLRRLKGISKYYKSSYMHRANSWNKLSQGR